MLLYDKRAARPGSRRTWYRVALVSFAVALVAGVAAQRSDGPRRAVDRLVRSARHIPARAKAWSAAPRLRTLDLDVGFKHVLTLEQKRHQAIDDGVLLTSGDDFVPGGLRVGGKSVPIKLRLKGDWTDHLRGSKCSYRIKAKGDAHLWGMRTFSVQHPSTRNWDGEWLYHKHLRREGVLALRYGLVKLRLNGDPLGIFALEENFSKELLESQGRREGVIIKPDEDGMWRRRVRTRKFHSLRHEDLSVMPIVAFQTSKIDRSAALGNCRDAATSRCRAVLDGEMPASRAFDVQSLARHLAVSELWAARHALTFHNFRYYYNPIDADLEPIGFDANPLLKPESGLIAPEGQWTARLLEDPVVADAYVRELWRLTSPDYVREMRDEWQADWKGFVAALRTEWPEFEADVWERLEARRHALRQLLTRREAIGGTYRVETRGAHRSVVLDLSAADALPVQVLGVLVDGETVDVLPDEIPTVLYPRGWPNHATYLGHLVPENQVPVKTVEILCRSAGREEPVLVPLERFDTPPGIAKSTRDRTADECALAHEFLDIDTETRTATVRPGTWTVRQDLTVPDGWTLRIDAGTTLEFSPRTTLSGRMATRFRGTVDEPIRLSPAAGGRWAGVSLPHGPEATWSHVHVVGTEHGVEFHTTPARLDHCSFRDSTAESMLRLTSTRFHISDCDFRDGDHDSLVVTAAEGVLTDCRIRRAGRDGVVVSEGGHLRLDSVVIDEARGRALVADRGSAVESDFLTIRRAEAGVVCLGGSSATLRDLYLRRVRTGLRARRGDHHRGTSEIDVVRYRVLHVPDLHDCRFGASISVDANRVAATGTEER